MITWLHYAAWIGDRLFGWGLALAAALLAYGAMVAGLRMALGRLSRLAEHTGTRIDNDVIEVLAGTSRWLVALAAVLIGIGLLELPDRWAGRLGQLWFLVAVLQAALWANRLIVIVLRRHAQGHAAGQASGRSSAAATLVSWGVRMLLWTVVVLAMLSNVGVNITAFVASLGVGGIAVALAAQNVLGDLFASLSIAIDKPFEVGDFIVLGDVSGTVELVGVKTTRIRSLGGEQVVMSNTELLKQTVRNYKRLQHRRIVFGFGITYDTPPAQVAEVAAAVERIVRASERLRFDRAHFLRFGDSSLDFEVVYIVLDAEYNVYMDEQQRINLALLRELESRRIGFAFPTRTLHLAPGAQARVGPGVNGGATA